MKHYLLYLFCCLFFLPATLLAQQFTFSEVVYLTDTVPNGTSGITGFALVPTVDRGYMLAGSANNVGMFAKIDSAGNVLWAKSISKTWQFSAVIATSDSDFVLAGSAIVPGDSSIAFCVKINPDGNIIWSSAFGRSNEMAVAVQQTIDSGYILTGGTTSSVYTSQPFVTRLDASGNIKWSMILSHDSITGIGNAAKQTPDSGYIITGALYSSVGGNETFITRLTSSGTQLWSKAYYSDSDSSFFIAGNDIVITRSGFLCFLNQIGLMKTDFNGNVLWERHYNEGGEGYPFEVRENPYLTATRNGRYLFSIGNCFGNTLTEVDSSGNIIFADDVNVTLGDVVEAKDKGLMIMGNGPQCGERVEGNSGSPQVGMIKADSLGKEPDCIFNSTGFGFYIDTIKGQSVVFTPLAMAGIKPFGDILNTVQLYTGSGCVSVEGAVKNYNFNSIGSIFPNPTADRVNVDLSVPSSISIFNLMGQQMFYESAKATEQNMPQVDVSAYPDGLYFLKAQSDNSIQTLKFIVQH